MLDIYIYIFISKDFRLIYAFAPIFLNYVIFFFFILYIGLLLGLHFM